MDNRVILKALALASIMATITLALLGGYTPQTSIDGVTWHHYSFQWIDLMLLILPIFVVPITFIIGYPTSLLLFRLNLFNIYTMSIAGSICGIMVISIVFYQFPPPAIVAFYYGVGGFVASTTTFFTYKYLTKNINI